MARAREISSLLTRQARGQAAPLANVRESALALASNPALASSVASGTPDEVAGRVIEMNRTVQRLASIDPAQGEQGSLTALRELTEGDTASLRRRFGISPQQLAQAVGSSVSDIRSDPSLALAGLSKIAETLVPDSVIEEQGRLVSTRIAKIADAMREGLDQVGRSGVYDDLADRLGELQRGVFKYLDSSEFRQQAQRIGDGLGRALDNAGNAVQSFLEAISANADAGGIAGAVGTAGGLLDKLALASDGLPRIAAQLGTGFGEVARVVGEAVAVLGELASKLDVATAVRMKFSPEDRERVRITNIARARGYGTGRRRGRPHGTGGKAGPDLGVAGGRPEGPPPRRRQLRVPDLRDHARRLPRRVAAAPSPGRAGRAGAARGRAEP